MTDLTGAPNSALPAVDRRGLLARFRSDRFFLVGAVIVALSLFLAAFGPLISPYDPLRSTGEISVSPPPIETWPRLFYETISGAREAPPHWFGTDQSGLDVFSRVISAPRADMTIALGGALISLVIGHLPRADRRLLPELGDRVHDANLGCAAVLPGLHHRDDPGRPLRPPDRQSGAGAGAGLHADLRSPHPRRGHGAERARLCAGGARGRQLALDHRDQARVAQLAGALAGADVGHHRLCDHPYGRAQLRRRRRAVRPRRNGAA